MRTGKMKISLVVLGMLSLNGCVMMTSKEFQRNQNLWQSIGFLSGKVECSQSIIELQAQELVKTKSKKEIQDGK